VQRTSATQVSQIQAHSWASAARLGLWKYVYAGCAVAWVGCCGALAFWCAGAVSRYLLVDFERSATWAQKSGLLLGLSAFTLLLLNIVTFLIGLVTSSASWLAVLFAGSGLSWWAVVGLSIAANVFTYYLSDPWLKGLLLVCLFPCLLPLVLAGSTLAMDIWRLGISKSRERVLTAAQGRLGRAFIPLLMTLMALYGAYWILSRLL
jgi:hypothetical protein